MTLPARFLVLWALKNPMLICQWCFLLWMSTSLCSYVNPVSICYLGQVFLLRLLRPKHRLSNFHLLHLTALFVFIDVPSAWREASSKDGASKLAQDIDNILSEEDEWSFEEEASSSPHKNTRKMPSRVQRVYPGTISHALLQVRHWWNGFYCRMPSKLHKEAVSDPPNFKFDSGNASFTKAKDKLSGRLRRKLLVGQQRWRRKLRTSYQTLSACHALRVQQFILHSKHQL